MEQQRNEFHATTIVAVRHEGRTAIAGDGQVTFGQHTVMKANARKVRRIYHDSVLAGFAGSVADAFTLFEKFEAKLEEFNGNLLRSSVELAKEWRTDKVLRRLEALLLVADSQEQCVTEPAKAVLTKVLFHRKRHEAMFRLGGHHIRCSNHHCYYNYFDQMFHHIFGLNFG